ncbi:hypothetical protein QQS21_007188 [Conoideocrella luteorostrata]|uniref:Activator of Hsp90 ATPase homologue 1/2-like C-terminal domain-containing protein n=1 Tax=Conoideocrella luteorostrata TaxID=1105319 RepID=A0AAJ0CL79_9HYPO|nr:hypothetical protein QQS21_007188 [Conoideocrella luteorostrata]
MNLVVQSQRRKFNDQRVSDFNTPRTTMDYNKQVSAVQRSVSKPSTISNGKDARSISLTQSFPTDPQNLWDAITKPDRLKAWFSPVSGDLHVNGAYSIEGNASGTILECEAPKRFALTWEFCEGMSSVTVTLSHEPSSGTTLRLKHTFDVDDHWLQYGAGAAGIGWDMSFLGLAMHLRNLPKPSEDDWAASANAAEFTERSSVAWMIAAIRGGEAEDQAKAAAHNSTVFYLPGWESKTL